MVGAELMQGTNEAMFGNAQIVDPNSIDPEDPDILGSDKRAPSLYVGYVKSSFDIGSTTILPGISYIYGSTRLDHIEDEGHAYAGDSSIYAADLTVKHFFDSYSFLTWQSEWMMRNMELTEYDTSGVITAQEELTKKQAGYYTQLVYAQDQNWRYGVRYDSIYQNDVTGSDLPEDMKRYSAMLEYHPSEFSRIRLEYNRNDALFNEAGERQDLDTIMLQFNIAIGAHGAHDF
jgi:hypothetical protein